MSLSFRSWEREDETFPFIFPPVNLSISGEDSGKFGTGKLALGGSFAHRDWILFLGDLLMIWRETSDGVGADSCLRAVSVRESNVGSNGIIKNKKNIRNTRIKREYIYIIM